MLARFLLRGGAALLAALLLYMLVRFVLPALAPFLIALAAAAALEPAVRFLERRLHLRRGFSAALGTLFLLFILLGLLAFFGVSLLRQAEGLAAQLALFAENLAAPMQRLGERFARFGTALPPWLATAVDGFFADFAQTFSSLLTSAASWLLGKLGSLAAAVPKVLLAAATSLLAVYFTSAAYPTLRAWAGRLKGKNFGETAATLRTTLLRWLRAQLTLFSLTFAQLLLGFTLLGSDFALLGAFLTALVDLLPVLGTGTVLIPWALFALLADNAPRALGLVLLYLTTLLVRNIVEPRLLASLAGVPPIVSLAAMYLGFCSFGVGGMLLFPLLLLLTATLIREKKDGP